MASAYESYLERVKQLNREFDYPHNARIVPVVQKGQEAMEITINGIKMTGTAAQLAEVARKLGANIGNDGVHYLSSSRGLIRIDQMSEEHLLRTIRKRIREAAQSVQTLEGIEFLTGVSNANNDVTTRAMLTQYQLLVSRRTGRNIIARY